MTIAYLKNKLKKEVVKLVNNKYQNDELYEIVLINHESSEVTSFDAHEAECECVLWEMGECGVGDTCCGSIDACIIDY
jgi:hypothetical protein